jgi:hypothetical protein
MCTGRTTLSSTLLAEEYARVVTDQTRIIREQQNLTLCIDGWTDRQKKSIYATNIITPDREMHLLGMTDLSIQTHSAEFLKGDETVNYMSCINIPSVYCTVLIAATCLYRMYRL